MSHNLVPHILAFDIYGTLFDTNSLRTSLETHAKLSPRKAVEVTTLWRKYQLEYTWRLNSMGIYEPFDTVTKNSLLHAAAESNVILEDYTVAALMHAYHTLESFDDAFPVLQSLAQLPNVDICIFSNGTPSMVTTALRNAKLSPLSMPNGNDTTAPVHELELDMYLADTPHVFKPARAIYDGLLAHVGVPQSEAGRVWLISGNPFDVTGARNAGLNVIWVDRAQGGWVDRLVPRERGPTKIVHQLREIATLFET